MLVWSKKGVHGYDVHITRRSNSKWSKPEQLSFSDNEEILPTVAFTPSGRIWVVWSEITGGLSGRLRYRSFFNGQWHSPKYVDTNTSSDFAASTIVDINGDIWLVWSGTDASDDDIYYARWHQTEWTPPKRVNTDDEIPDVLPKLALNIYGMPQVTWTGFDGHQYKTFSSEWDGKRWGSELIVGDVSQELDNALTDDLIQLPDFVSDLSQASVHVRKGNRAQTFRIKNENHH